MLGYGGRPGATIVDAVRRVIQSERRMNHRCGSIAKGCALPDIKVLGLDSWRPTSLPARKRSATDRRVRPLHFWSE